MPLAPISFLLTNPTRVKCSRSLAANNDSYIINIMTVGQSIIIAKLLQDNKLKFSRMFVLHWLTILGLLSRQPRCYVSLMFDLAMRKCKKYVD